MKFYPLCLYIQKKEQRMDKDRSPSHFYVVYLLLINMLFRQDQPNKVQKRITDDKSPPPQKTERKIPSKKKYRKWMDNWDNQKWCEDWDICPSPFDEMFKQDVPIFWYSDIQAQRELPIIPAHCTVFNGVDSHRLVHLKRIQIRRMCRLMSGPDYSGLGSGQDLDKKFHAAIIRRFRIVQIRTLASYIARAFIPWDAPVYIIMILFEQCVDDPLYKEVRGLCLRTIQNVYDVRKARN
jgi:hypothetical protein